MKLRYKVLRKCHGFKGRLWEEGEIVDLEENDKPPKHFTLVGESPEDAQSVQSAKHPELVPKESQPKTLSELGKKFRPDVKTGMGANLDTTPEPGNTERSGVETEQNTPESEQAENAPEEAGQADAEQGEAGEPSSLEPAQTNENQENQEEEKSEEVVSTT